jgi:hypothetical protein
MHKLKVLEKKVLWRMPGPKGEEVTGCRKVHNEECHNFLLFTNYYIRVVKSRRIDTDGEERKFI